MNAKRIYEQARVRRNLRAAAAPQPPAQQPVAGADVLTADQVVEALRTLNRRVQEVEQKVSGFDERLDGLEQAITEIRGASVKPTPAKRVTKLVTTYSPMPSATKPHKTLLIMPNEKR